MRPLLVFVLLSAIPFFAFTQTKKGADTLRADRNKQHKPYTANISFFNESVSLPFHKVINSSFHPGAQAGIEGRYFENAKSKLFQTLNLGIYYNKYNGTSFYLNTELAYRYTSKFRISAETLLGIGYIRTYHPADIYELSGNGTYQKASDNGFSSAIYSLAIG